MIFLFIIEISDIFANIHFCQLVDISYLVAKKNNHA
jgi:hypothetical protein